MPLLSNVLISISRSAFTAASGTTGTPTTIATSVPAHIMPTLQVAYRALPQAALESDFQVTVDSGVNAIEGDEVTITLLDGVTSWPGIGATNANETFRVTYTEESTPGPLAHRKVYVTRVRGGGTVY